MPCANKHARLNLTYRIYNINKYVKCLKYHSEFTQSPVHVKRAFLPISLKCTQINKYTHIHTPIPLVLKLSYNSTVTHNISLVILNQLNIVEDV